MTVCMYVSAPHACPVPREARRVSRSPGTSYTDGCKPLYVLETKYMSSMRAPVLFTEPPLQKLWGD